MSVHSALYMFLLSKDVEFHYYFEDGEQMADPLTQPHWKWFDEYVFFLETYAK